MNLFKDKVAIVTGGGSGIGRALCEELGQLEAAVVVVADINAEAAQQVALSINSNGGRAQDTYLDVTKAEDVEKLICDIAKEYGRLDYMFNNAGIAITGEVRNMNLEHWKRIINVNLWGVIHGTTVAYQVMSKQGFGHIVNTASAAGLIPTPINTLYSTTKHAVVGLSTSLHAESGVHGVNVSVVCPGFIKTSINESSEFVKVNKNEFDKMTSHNVMSAPDCAKIILDGVKRNKPIIPITSLAHIAWFIYRLFPNFFIKLMRKSSKKRTSLLCDS